MTRTTPEMAPPLQAAAPHQRRMFDPQHQIWRAPGPHTRRVFSRIGFRTWSLLAQKLRPNLRRSRISGLGVPNPSRNAAFQALWSQYSSQKICSCNLISENSVATRHSARQLTQLCLSCDWTPFK
ncbi:hypothetical protein AVEN_207391-1 [Araneus ventricosus]|uniref:Uncharacterized protein n=1 Tax=Araneus ventricosus TaxID=182803 RepID=A0A4Y2LNK9_ARAVE|nr:hypothetical protein AVEN_207391-1 [Araneus ventricosus]